ncbi:MAG: hypothetical protein V1850_00325 [Candidatus Bathyarchaeota archaeon]
MLSGEKDYNSTTGEPSECPPSSSDSVMDMLHALMLNTNTSKTRSQEAEIRSQEIAGMALENLKINQETLMQVIRLNHEIQRKKMEREDNMTMSVLKAVESLINTLAPALTSFVVHKEEKNL